MQQGWLPFCGTAHPSWASHGSFLVSFDFSPHVCKAWAEILPAGALQTWACIPGPLLSCVTSQEPPNLPEPQLPVCCLETGIAPVSKAEGDEGESARAMGYFDTDSCDGFPPCFLSSSNYLSRSWALSSGEACVRTENWKNRSVFLAIAFWKS